MKQKFLIIDCQVFQTPAWDRGMGKYSLFLLKELFRQGVITSNNTKLVLNSNIQINDSVINAINDACPGVNIEFIKLAIPKGNKIIKQKIRNKNILTDYVSNYTEEYEVDFLILSLFLDQACPEFPDNATKILLFYDLIPLMYFRRYLGVGPAEKYLGHFKTVFDAEIIYTISETVANDLSSFLGINPSKIININGASIGRTDIEPKKPKKHPTKKFILMPSGGELRKNNHRTVQGFENYNQANREYQLVLTSSFGQGMIDSLDAMSPDLLFTGNVSEQELKWLYDNCELVLFGSEYEGLGLPILEAVEAGKKVACSNIPVFREISNAAFNYFDHLDPNDISKVINSALNKSSISDKLYIEIATKYSWANSVKLMRDGLESIPEKEASFINKKVAVVSPSVGSSSVSARSISMMHSTLSEDAKVDYYFDEKIGDIVRPNYLKYCADVFSIEDFNADKYKTYDEVIYHLTDEECSAMVLKAALCYPGRQIIYSEGLMEPYDWLLNNNYISSSRAAQALEDVHLKDLKSRSISSLEYDNGKGSFSFPSYELPYKIPKKTNHALDQIGIILRKLDNTTIEWLGAILDNFKNHEITPRIISLNEASPQNIEFLERFYNASVYSNITEYDLEIHLGGLDSVIISGYDDGFLENELRVTATKYGVYAVVDNNTSKYDENTISDQIFDIIKDGDKLFTQENAKLLKSANQGYIVSSIMKNSKKSEEAGVLREAIYQSSSKAQVINIIRGQ